MENLNYIFSNDLKINLKALQMRGVGGGGHAICDLSRIVLKIRLSTFKNKNISKPNKHSFRKKITENKEEKWFCI